MPEYPKVVCYIDPETIIIRLIFQGENAQIKEVKAPERRYNPQIQQTLRYFDAAYKANVFHFQA